MSRAGAVLCTLILLGSASAAGAQTPDPPPLEPELSERDLVKLPTRAILVRGAEPSASDPETPVPEGGWVIKSEYRNPYFGLAYELPADWSENYSGPPPSDTGTYVLALAGTSPASKAASRGTLLIQAHDLFFSLADAKNAMELATFAKDTLESFYVVERSPTEVTIARRPFVRFDYASEVAGLHWVVLTTEIRCHAVQFIFSSNDPKLLDARVRELDTALVVDAGEAPRCIASYAEGKRVTNRVEPEIRGPRRYNAVPVRVIIDTRGNVRHVHAISAYPEQAAAIQEALLQWKFEPLDQNGKRVEVETGIQFGSVPPWPKREKKADGHSGE